MHKGKRIIIHDFFLYRWGAERFNIMAANTLWADLAAFCFDGGSFDLSAMGFSGKLIAYGKKRFSGGLKYLYFKLRLLVGTRFLKDYDTVIFTGDTLSAGRYARKDAKKICYFHSIPRYLFDQKDLYYAKVPWWAKWPYLALRSLFLRMFLSEIARMDALFVNSKNLQRYLKEHIGYESEIIYPPVDMSVFFPASEDNRFRLPKSLDGAWGLHTGESVEYYISYSKASTLKRVIEVVRAFREMPEKKLLVIYGANDPQKDEMLALAADAKNIETIILSDNSMLPDLVARAVATMFIPKNEDFWMVATESMACGVPVIGVAEWGLLETVIDGKTGILISGTLSTNKIKKAVTDMTHDRSLSMTEACILQAKNFSRESFDEIIRRKFD